ncbi:MAG: phosphate acyltransferase PlsX [Magnetococcales bacterium]|nr:phosphate acyltransferase PlsX [Magnetococcales bacterium]
MARIALDAMGGDHAPDMVIEGAAMAARSIANARFLLVGPETVLKEACVRYQLDESRFEIIPASQVVDMAEKPSVALRKKKDSSMVIGARLVKEGRADAFVSAGNTGALMAIARFILRTLPGIDRPAIASLMPTCIGSTLMLDLGANVDCTVEHLLQFALMGEVYAKAVMGLTGPRIGLLNIGEEEMKGNEVVRQTGERLRGNPCFAGNVEGTDLFAGRFDVVVCDGFAGNVSLKSAEGVAHMLIHFLKEAFGHSWLTRFGYLMAKPALNRFKDRVDPRRYNGAMLLGLNGIVVKSHGSADALAYRNAIEVAVNLATKRVNEKIAVEVGRQTAAALTSVPGGD